ncbi:MAG: LPS assembly lipoprotein LptE [Phycisphaerales bacterium]
MSHPARLPTLLMFAVTFASLLPTFGCKGDGQTGYHSADLFPANIRTVKLDIFANRTFYQGVEMELSEAMVKEIELRSPYKVTNAAGADTQLTGTIIAIEQGTLSRTFDAGLPQEVQTRITVSFEWKDLRSGQVIRRRDRIIGSGEYVPTRVVGEPMQTAQHQAVAELARDIVSVMRSDW